jgi:hypothetical protein
MGEIVPLRTRTEMAELVALVSAPDTDQPLDLPRISSTPSCSPSGGGGIRGRACSLHDHCQALDAGAAHSSFVVLVVVSSWRLTRSGDIALRVSITVPIYILPFSALSTKSFYWSFIDLSPPFTTALLHIIILT